MWRNGREADAYSADFTRAAARLSWMGVLLRRVAPAAVQIAQLAAGKLRLTLGSGADFQHPDIAGLRREPDVPKFGKG
jgi:hypothetical protein